VTKETDLLEHSPTLEQLNISQPQAAKEVVEADSETIEILATKKQLTTQAPEKNPPEPES